MTREERRKAIENAVALAAGNVLVPVAVRVGIAAMVEELRDHAERITALELGTADPTRPSLTRKEWNEQGPRKL